MCCAMIWLYASCKSPESSKAVWFWPVCPQLSESKSNVLDQRKSPPRQKAINWTLWSERKHVSEKWQIAFLACLFLVQPLHCWRGSAASNGMNINVTAYTSHKNNMPPFQQEEEKIGKMEKEPFPFKSAKKKSLSSTYALSTWQDI